MDQQQTCGRGLAENSLLPGKLGELAVAMAENLEAHMRALDMTDPVSRQEYEAYVLLANEQRETAALLLATANEMAGARDLPMGPHDPHIMSGPQVLQAFEKFVQVKQELFALLQQTAERDQSLLLEMRSLKTR